MGAPKKAVPLQRRCVILTPVPCPTREIHASRPSAVGSRRRRSFDLADIERRDSFLDKRFRGDDCRHLVQVLPNGGAALYDYQGDYLIRDSTFAGHDPNSTIRGFSNSSLGVIGNTIIRGFCILVEHSSGNYNIESPGDTCGFDFGADQVSVPTLQLGLQPVLSDNGGPTSTLAIAAETVAAAIEAPSAFLEEVRDAQVDGGRRSPVAAPTADASGSLLPPWRRSRPRGWRSSIRPTRRPGEGSGDLMPSEATALEAETRLLGDPLGDRLWYKST